MQRKHKGNQRRPIMNAFKNKNTFTIHSRKKNQWKINKKNITAFGDEKYSKEKENWYQKINNFSSPEISRSLKTAIGQN